MSFFTGRRQSDADADLKSSDSPAIGFDTVLSASTVLDGTLKSEGNIRLDGHFTGKLDITGNVLVGETAEINADIEARNISIAGIVRGNIVGNKVQLLKTGRIWGDIQSNSLTTEEGAFIEGNVMMEIPSPEPEPILEETAEADAVIDDDTISSVSDSLEQTDPDISGETHLDNIDSTE